MAILQTSHAQDITTAQEKKSHKFNFSEFYISSSIGVSFTSTKKPIFSVFRASGYAGNSFPKNEGDPFSWKLNVGYFFNAKRKIVLEWTELSFIRIEGVFENIEIASGRSFGLLIEEIEPIYKPHTEKKGSTELQYGIGLSIFDVFVHGVGPVGLLGTYPSYHYEKLLLAFHFKSGIYHYINNKITIQTVLDFHLVPQTFSIPKKRGRFQYLDEHKIDFSRIEISLGFGYHF